MTKFTADFTGVSDESGVSHIPPGYYQLKLTKAQLGRAKESKQPIVRVDWTVLGPGNRGSKLIRTFSLQPQALFSIRNMLLALGYQVPKKKVNLDTDQWLNRECGAEIIDREFIQNGKKRVASEVATFLTLAEYEAVRSPSKTEPAMAEVAADVAALLEDEETDELALGEASDDDDDDDDEEETIDLDDL